MPYGLKNASATFRRLVNKVFKNHLGDTIEVYIGDMLVKPKKVGDHFQHLTETFEVLRKHNMKLNPTKCSVGVAVGKFLGYIVTQRGIEAYPNQVKAISISNQPLT